MPWSLLGRSRASEAKYTTTTAVEELTLPLPSPSSGSTDSVVAARNSGAVGVSGKESSKRSTKSASEQPHQQVAINHSSLRGRFPRISLPQFPKLPFARECQMPKSSSSGSGSPVDTFSVQSSSPSTAGRAHDNSGGSSTTKQENGNVVGASTELSLFSTAKQLSLTDESPTWFRSSSWKAGHDGLEPSDSHWKKSFLDDSGTLESSGSYPRKEVMEEIRSLNTSSSLPSGPNPIFFTKGWERMWEHREEEARKLQELTTKHEAQDLLDLEDSLRRGFRLDSSDPWGTLQQLEASLERRMADPGALSASHDSDTLSNDAWVGSTLIDI